MKQSHTFAYKELSETTVSKWCTNTTQPDLQTLKRITELLEVNIQDLINFS